MKLFILLAVLFGSYSCRSQVEKTIDLPITPGATRTIQSLLYLPDNYTTTTTKYPLLVFLHGASQSCPPLSSIYNNASAGGPAYFIEHSGWPSSFTNPANGQTYKFIVISPQSDCNGWSSDGNQTDYMIRQMVADYRVDTTRIYLTGISAGGDGIIRYIAHLPSDAGEACNPRYKVAAFVAMSAAAGDIGQANSNIIVADSVRAWGFGDPGGDVHGSNTQLIMNEMYNAKPGIARFTSYTGGHCCWGTYYNPNYRETINAKSMNIYEWMLQFTRSNTTATGQAATTAVTTHSAEPVSISGCPSHKKYYLSPGYKGGVLIAPDEGGQTPFIYTGGDTIVFRSGPKWGDIIIRGINGVSQSCPITIINEGGQVTMKSSRLLNSKYIHWTGTGTRGIFYGFKAEYDPYRNNLGGIGVSFEGRSKCVIYDHIYMHNVNQGIFGHTENTCVDSLIYPHWIMDSLIIHDCKIVGTAHEGMYIGSTSPDNSPKSYDPRPVDCNGTIKYPRPMRTGYVHVYDCILDSTGRGGIQVASASGGAVEINNNIVRHAGMSGLDNQGTGISIGAYTHAYIHDNKVINTLTWGIASLGGSGTNIPVRIENNYIDSTGYLYTFNNILDTLVTTPAGPFYPPGKIPGHGTDISFVSPIFLKTVPILDTDSTMFWIKNNRLGISKGGPNKIKLENGYGTMRRTGNIICNNTNLSDGSPVGILADIGKFPTYSTNCSKSK